MNDKYPIEEEIPSFQHTIFKRVYHDGTVTYEKIFTGKKSWWGSKNKWWCIWRLKGDNELYERELFMTRNFNNRYFISTSTDSIVTSNIKGKTLDRVSRPSMKSVARLLASIHTRKIDDCEKYLADASIKNQLSRIKSTSFNNFLIKNDDDKVILHGDFHLGNVMFYKSKATAIDFEEAAYGSRYWDLAEFCRCLILTKKDSSKLIERFLYWYERYADIYIDVFKLEIFMNLIAARNIYFNSKLPPSSPKVNTDTLELKLAERSKDIVITAI